MVKRNKYMNVPEIRFKGLDKTWNKKTLDELVQLNSGMDYKHLCNGNIPVYGTGGYMLSVNEGVSKFSPSFLCPKPRLSQAGALL